MQKNILHDHPRSREGLARIRQLLNLPSPPPRDPVNEDVAHKDGAAAASGRVSRYADASRNKVDGGEDVVTTESPLSGLAPKANVPRRCIFAPIYVVLSLFSVSGWLEPSWWPAVKNKSRRVLFVACGALRQS